MNSRLARAHINAKQRARCNVTERPNEKPVFGGTPPPPLGGEGVGFTSGEAANETVTETAAASQQYANAPITRRPVKRRIKQVRNHMLGSSINGESEFTCAELRRWHPEGVSGRLPNARVAAGFRSQKTRQSRKGVESYVVILIRRMP